LTKSALPIFDDKENASFLGQEIFTNAQDTHDHTEKIETQIETKQNPHPPPSTPPLPKD